MIIQDILHNEFKQPVGSNMCGAYTLAMALKVLDCDFTHNIPIPGEDALFLGRHSVIRSNDNFHGIAGAIYQVTGYFSNHLEHGIFPVLEPGVCALNGPAGMIAVAIGAGLPADQMAFRYTGNALHALNGRFPGELIRVNNLLHPMHVVEDDPVIPQHIHAGVYIGLFENGGGGYHWVVFTHDGRYDPATGATSHEHWNHLFDRENALMAIHLNND